MLSDRFFRRIVALLVLAISPLSAAGEAVSERLPVRTLLAASGRCVGLDRHEVCQEAEQRARQQLLAELGQLAEELTGRTFSQRQLVGEQAWLASQPGVERKSEMTLDEKPYGPVAEKAVCLAVPEAVLTAWATRLAEQHRRHTVRVLGGTAGTVAGWLAGLLVLVKVDRLTGGYYRCALVPAVLVVLLASSALWWAWLIVSAW